LDQVVAEVFAWEDLLVRARGDLLVDDGIARGQERRPSQSQFLLDLVWEACPVRKLLKGVADVAEPVIAREIFAARDGNGAEPSLVGHFAVFAIPD
jgi:hypothetical protein